MSEDRGGKDEEAAMKLTDYRELRSGLQRNAFAGDAEARVQMRDLLRETLAGSGLFHSVEVDTTDDVDRLVIALVEFEPGVDTDELAWQLERWWHDVLAYPFWSAESFLVEDGHVELQGSTRLSQQGHYLTLHVVAQESVPAERPAADAVIPAQAGERVEAPAVASMPTQAEPQEAPSPLRRLLGRS